MSEAERIEQLERDLARLRKVVSDYQKRLELCRQREALDSATIAGMLLWR